MIAWLPIETAPRDGQEFVGLDVDHNAVVVKWRGHPSDTSNGAFYETIEEYWSPKLTHWFALPDTKTILSDRDIQAAYQRTDGESAEAVALLSEIERRGLDI